MSNTAAQSLLSLFASRSISMSPDGMRGWVDALSDLTEQQVAIACQRFNRECNEYPTPPRVRSYVEPTMQQRAEIAWEAALKALRQYGACYSVDFEDPVINAAIRRIGGWKVFGEMTLEDRPFRRKEFISAYLSVAQNWLGDSRPLIGEYPDERVRRVATGLPLTDVGRRMLDQRENGVLRIQQVSTEQ